MRAAVVLCVAVLAVSASAYREYARNGAGALHAAGAAVGDTPTQAQLTDIATRKATCPFVGSAVAGGHISVSHPPAGNFATQPLSLIDDVVRVGNTGAGSTLGYVLKVFSTGNHAKMLNPNTNKLEVDVPAGTFALDFPASQGAHAGHSGILMADPHTLNSGRWSQSDFQRLIDFAARGPSKGQYLTTKDIGEFIGENIARDPKSRTVTSGGLLSVLLPDSVKLLGDIGVAALKLFANPLHATAEDWRHVTSGITKLAGDDNLIGSAGEFGLLLAFLEHSPVAQQNSGNAFSVADITSMFRDKVFPKGWETWKKSAISWVTYSSQLTWYARKRYDQVKPKL